MNTVINADFVRKQRMDYVGQLEYSCECCGWTGDGDSYKSICPNCHDMEVKNTVNKRAEPVKDGGRDDETVRYLQSY